MSSKVRYVISTCNHPLDVAAQLRVNRVILISYVVVIGRIPWPIVSNLPRPNVISQFTRIDDAPATLPARTCAQRSNIDRARYTLDENAETSARLVPFQMNFRVNFAKCSPSEYGVAFIRIDMLNESTLRQDFSYIPRIDWMLLRFKIDSRQLKLARQHDQLRWSLSLSLPNPSWMHDFNSRPRHRGCRINALRFSHCRVHNFHFTYVPIISRIWKGVRSAPCTPISWPFMGARWQMAHYR